VATLHVTGLSKGYGANVVFDDVSFRLPPRERLALIGRNGAGKTTLLRTIAGELDPDAGTIGVPRGYRVALHDQRPPLQREITLAAYVGEGLSDVRAAEEQLAELEGRMAAGDGSDETLRSYDAAQAALEAAGGYAWRSRMESILRGLGFHDEDIDRPLRSFSGGELTRGSLARALASNPDLLLLDEPTNHLDLASLEWLEDELASLDCSVLLVSHDRWFLERVATGVLELERGRGKVYNMRYSAYRREKADALANQADAYERQQEEMARLQRFVDKFRAGTRSRQAASRQKMLDRIERVEKPRHDKALAFGFARAERSGRIVVEVEKLVLTAGDKALLDGATVHVERGQRVALIGPNGAGKTTLVETILGRRAPVSGKAKLGHNVTPAYFSQHAAELKEHHSVVESMLAQARVKLTNTQARTILGRFLFTQDEVERKVEVLSGGERRRLALASLVASGANFLVLDEPTNHLDVESREALEEALDAYDGTILLVSHDRALIDAVATHTASIEDRRIVLRHGDYNDYLEAKAGGGEAPQKPAPKPAPRAAPAKKPAAQAPPKKRPSQRVLREITQIEAKIEQLEQEQQRIETELADPEVLGDAERVSAAGIRHRELQEELAWKLREWEQLQEQAATA
jgi:ATP-binding cassette subfamily F protein 3